MSSEEARSYVQSGLDQKKADRADREAQLENYEKDMMEAISEKAAIVRKNERQQQNREIIRSVRDIRKLERARRDQAAEAAVRKYAYISLIIMLFANWTPIPWYGAAALVAGLAVLTAAYIFRLYYPLKEVNQNGKCESSV